MPTATWREEKSEFVVKAICHALATPGLPEVAREELEGEALSNALKLFAEAVCDRLGSSIDRWSPAMVEAFRKEPEKCTQFLELMMEPDFSVAGYWRSE